MKKIILILILTIGCTPTKSKINDIEYRQVKNMICFYKSSSTTWTLPKGKYKIEYYPSAYNLVNMDTSEVIVVSNYFDCIYTFVE